MAYCFSHGPSRTTPWVPPHLQPSHTQNHTPPKHPRRHASVVPPHLRQPSSPLRLAPFDHNHFHEPSTAHKYSCHRIEDIGGLSKKNSSLDTHTTMPHYNQNFPYESFLRPAPRHTTRPQFPESHVPPHLRKNLVQTQAKRPLHRQRAHLHHGGTQKQESPSCQYALDSFGSNSDWDLISGYEGSDELGSTAHHMGRACIVVGAPISSRNIWEEHIAAIQASRQEMASVHAQLAAWRQNNMRHCQDSVNSSMHLTILDEPLINPVDDQHLIEQEREFEDAAISKEIMEFVVEAECDELGGNSAPLLQHSLGQKMVNQAELGMEMRQIDVSFIEAMDAEIMMSGQRLFEKRFNEEFNKEVDDKPAPSLGLQNAMKCLEVQRKFWDIGCSFSIIPAVPHVHFIDPFLVENVRPIPLGRLPFAPFQTRDGNEMEKWEFGVPQLGRSHLATWAASSPSKQGATLLGSWFSLWRPPDLGIKKHLVRWFLSLRDAWSALSRPPDFEYLSGIGLIVCSYDSRSNHIKAGWDDVIVHRLKGVRDNARKSAWNSGPSPNARLSLVQLQRLLPLHQAHARSP